MTNNRQAEILQMLQESGSLEVQELARRFHTTPTTIRRDLVQMEQKKLIGRSYGKAYIDPQFYQSDFKIRKDLRAQEKELLAREACRMIQPHESIILDSGTTMLALAECMLENPIEDVTVLTPSLPIATRLAERYQVQMPGGMLHAPSLALVGPSVEQYFQSVRVDKCFASSTGVFNGKGLSASSSYHVAGKKAMVAAANKVIALIDSSKYLISGVNLICEFQKVDTLITFQTEQNARQLREIMDSGVRVLILDNSK